MSFAVYLVMPDLSRAKLKAIAIASSQTPFGILVSYSILKMKPITIERLLELRAKTDIPIMLDSGAYHLLRLNFDVDIKDYAEFASKYRRVFDIVVAPDVPGDCETTLERTRIFSRIYDDDFLPVAQGKSIEEHVRCAERLADYARGYLGIGGLDDERKRVKYLRTLVSLLPPGLHLFGVGSRLVHSLSSSRLLWKVKSIDTSGWLAEIKFRRRSVLGASDVLEANAKAIVNYIERLRRHSG